MPKLVESIKFEKSMRWNDSGVAFSRPIRWYVALLGDMVIPFEYAGVASGNISRGLRPYGSPEITIPSADKYFDVIREAGILLDKEERKASIVEQVNQAAALIGGEAIIEEGLLNEVTNLIEMPTAVMGGFNEEFLSLPRDVLISVMKKHQRYFPVRNVLGSGQHDCAPTPAFHRHPQRRRYSTLTPSAKGTNTFSARALPMPTSSSAKMSNSNSKNIVPNFFADLPHQTRLHAG